MALVRFDKGLEENYNPDVHSTSIYQCTDTGNTYIFGQLNTHLTDNDVKDIIANTPIEDIVSYGVEKTSSSPDLLRIGNLTLHKTLPIQSQLRGCVAQGKEIKYYLNPTDWSLKEDGTPSVLDGTDGDVMIHVPRFYGKSGVTDIGFWVRISTIKVDESWTEIPEMLISAYRVARDASESGNIKLRSVVNPGDTYKGNGNDNSGSLEWRTNICKPITAISRATARTYARNRNDGTELLNYEYYKWVLYWLPVIEYATFKLQQAFTNELTPEGYHKGGLGLGITQWNSYVWSAFTSYYPICKLGFTNEFGNYSGVKTYEGDTEFSYITNGANTNWSSWTHRNTDYVAHTYTSNSMTITNVVSDTYVAYSGFTTTGGAMTFTVSGLAEGQGIIFRCSDMDDVTVTTNSQVTVNWPQNTNSRYIYFTFTGTCNITITIDSNTSVEYTLNMGTTQANRYRGFENIFGDIWTNLEGIIAVPPSGDETNMLVYTTINPDNYQDTDTSVMKLTGHEIYQEGYIGNFDIQDSGEIIPKANGGTSTTGMCDYHYCVSSNGNRTVLVGGAAADGSVAGLGYWRSDGSVSFSSARVGFRIMNILN